MIRYFYFAAFLLFFSCSEENKSEQINADQSKTPNGTNFSSQNKIDYGPSNVELITQKDSISYVLGLKISEQFYGQTEFKSLDRELISQGFSDEIGSYDINKCFSDVQAYMASESTRDNKSFADSCARGVGRLSKDEFIKNMNKLESLDLFDDKTLCLGFSDGISLKNVFSNEPETEMRIFEELNQSLEIKNREIVLRVKEEGIEFLKKNKTKKGIKETKSGLQYKILRKGKGPNPTENSRVKVHYRGTVLSGEEFDSSYKRGEPSEFGLNQVIPGWTEGIQLMRPGAKFIFYIPQELAYGANPNPRSGIKPYSLLIFEVELLEIL